jgi:hypothetical protein
MWLPVIITERYCAYQLEAGNYGVYYSDDVPGYDSQIASVRSISEASQVIQELVMGKRRAVKRLKPASAAACSVARSGCNNTGGSLWSSQVLVHNSGLEGD